MGEEVSMEITKSEQDELISYLQDLMARQFFGVVELHLQNGHLTTIKESRTLKLQHRDTRKDNPSDRNRV